jgi:hypothetical protein
LRLETKEGKMGVDTPEINGEKSWCGWFHHQVRIEHCSGLDSLIQFIFCDAQEQGVWHDIRSGIEATVRMRSDW